MAKYKISKEFFPFSCFTPPISENFLKMAVPHMKTPKFIFRDKELDVSLHEIESYDGEKLECFLMSPRSVTENAPCLIYIHGGFVLASEFVSLTLMRQENVPTSSKNALKAL